MGKESVYELLASQGEAFLSGQAISAHLGVSRAAVWKAVEQLRRSGVEVEAHSGRGYRLCGVPDKLTGQEIGRCLALPRCEIICLETVDSTNSYCKRIATEGAAHGTVVIADEQSGGRGRLGRTFVSPGGKGVYLSILWRPAVTPEKLLSLTALGAVAVCRAVERVCGVRPGIKWPNDVVLGGRKVCGILTEMALEGESGLVAYVVMGVGINVHQHPEDFAGELASIASSLDEQTKTTVARPRLAAALIEELDRLYAELLPDPAKALAEYRQCCVTLGKTVELHRSGRKETAYARAVDEQYGLVVDFADGREETVRSGEVSVRGKGSYLN